MKNGLKESRYRLHRILIPGVGLIGIMMCCKGLALEQSPEPRINSPEKIAQKIFLTWEKQLREAESFRDSGRLSEAIVLYKALLTEWPDYRPALEGLALVYAYAKDYESSIAIYQQLLADNPKDLGLKQQLAKVHSWQGNYPEAIALYTSILERAPEQLEVHLNLAETLSWAGDYDEAITVYDKVIAINPNDKTAWLARPQVAQWAGQPEKAIAFYKTALAQYPGDPELLLGLAQIYQWERQYKQSLSILQPLIDERNPEALAIRNEIRAIRSTSKFETDSTDTQSSFSIDQTLRFRIDDGPILYSVNAGHNTFNQSGLSTLSNTKLQVGLEGQVNNLKITGTAGVDLFDRLPATPNLGFKVSTPLAPNLTFTGDLQYGAYKENVATLENQITAFRINPSISWQLDSETSLFASYNAGFYSDENLEHQALLLLERQLGDFFISGFLFYWSFADDPQNGYFAPSSFFLYSSEIGWRTNITRNLMCQASISIENEVFENSSALSNTYQAKCGLSSPPTLDLNLGYQYSTNAFFNAGTSSASQNVQGQINLIF